MPHRGGASPSRRAQRRRQRVCALGLANDGWQIATDDQASSEQDGKQCIVPTVFGAKRTILLDRGALLASQSVGLWVPETGCGIVRVAAGTIGG